MFICVLRAVCGGAARTRLMHTQPLRADYCCRFRFTDLGSPTTKYIIQSKDSADE